MRNEELKYIIGITLLEGVGDVIGKNLIAHCGSAEAVFKEKKHILQKIPDVGSILATSISKQKRIATSGRRGELLFEKQHYYYLFFR